MQHFEIYPSDDSATSARVLVDGITQRHLRAYTVSHRLGERPVLTLAFDAEGSFEGDGDVVVIPGADAVAAWLGQVSAGELERAALVHEGPGVSPGAMFLAGLRDLAAKGGDGGS